MLYQSVATFHGYFLTWYLKEQKSINPFDNPTLLISNSNKDKD